MPRTGCRATEGELSIVSPEFLIPELARRSSIGVSNISLLENERVEIGKKRAEHLAKAFDVHPAIIMFPEYEAKEIERAA